jgi:hypothetical protein
MQPFSRFVRAGHPARHPGDRLSDDQGLHWHTVRDERAATIPADDDIDYFLRRPRPLATHSTLPAVARAIACRSTFQRPAASAEAPGRPAASASAEARGRPAASAAAAPGQPGPRMAAVVPLLPVRPLAAPFAH